MLLNLPIKPEEYCLERAQLEELLRERLRQQLDSHWQEIQFVASVRKGLTATLLQPKDVPHHPV